MISARFKPAEDITAYELAQIVVRLAPNDRGVARFFFEDQWAGLSPELKRHFETDRDARDLADITITTIGADGRIKHGLDRSPA